MKLISLQRIKYTETKHVLLEPTIPTSYVGRFYLCVSFVDAKYIAYFQSIEVMLDVLLQRDNDVYILQSFAELLPERSENAGTLRRSWILGTSMLGFALKKFCGFKVIRTWSTGILFVFSDSNHETRLKTHTGQSSGRGMWVVPRA